MKKIFYLLIFTFACLVIETSQADAVQRYDPVEDQVGIKLESDGCFNYQGVIEVNIVYDILNLESVELIFPNSSEPAWNDIFMNASIPSGTSDVNLNDDYTIYEFWQVINDQNLDKILYSVDQQWMHRMSATKNLRL